MLADGDPILTAVRWPRWPRDEIRTIEDMEMTVLRAFDVAARFSAASASPA